MGYGFLYFETPDELAPIDRERGTSWAGAVNQNYTYWTSRTRNAVLFAASENNRRVIGVGCSPIGIAVVWWSRRLSVILT